MPQVLELKLEINQGWEPEGEEWQRTGRLVAMRKYQRALDVLEGLIVARMFELTKMNRSQTGYAMQKHIGKALQAQSPAIRTALERYNTAALALSPPHQTLQWRMGHASRTTRHGPSFQDLSCKGGDQPLKC